MSQVVTYKIVIPYSKITPRIMDEMFGSPSYCPIATHFTERGYKVIVGQDFIWFYPINIPATITHIGWTTKVLLDPTYRLDLERCAEAEEDFHFSIDLPFEIYHAVPGESTWRKKL